MELIQICLLKEIPLRDAGVIIPYVHTHSVRAHTDACVHFRLINWLSLCEMNVIMQGGVQKKWHSQQKNNMNIKCKIVFTFSGYGELYLTVS